ncbi:MAG: AAA family ATPase [Verrucomicrobiaceae bacterium]|nr:AAA family ATPase [Verrucomicrobiaceae bacterium]
MDPSQLDSLDDPDLFPDGQEGFEIVQTHLSVVCLAGDFAYKFKKSIRLPFADFSTLEQRRYFCEEELRLNRRLCPGIYLDVLPLRRDHEGTLHLGEGEGEVIDHCLRMRRLPADRMLDVLLRENRVTAPEIREIARQVVAFHAEARRGEEVRAWGDPDKLYKFALANFEETRAMTGPDGVLSGSLHAFLEERTRCDFEKHLPRMRERAAAGHIVDGHGDLHARNICLGDPLAIYDCIEFTPAFRCGDTATEHAFLLMDLRFRGHGELSAVYREAVLSATGDEKMIALLPMLVRYRAMVRAKVSAIEAGEAEQPADKREAAAATAATYLRLAAVSAIEEDGPWWLLFCGPPASGKSHLAAALAEVSRRGWPILASDRIRKELAGVAPTETLASDGYTADFSRWTYAELRRRAEDLTSGSGLVILDANFRAREERSQVFTAAKAAGAKLAIVRIETDERVVRRRLAARADDPASVSDADLAVYEKLKSAFEPPGEEEADRLLSVSGETGTDAAVEEILIRLARGR